MAHRLLLGAMSTPAPTPIEGEFFAGTAGLQRFTALPYFIDPQINVGMWHLDHGQAHQDAQVALPGYFGGETVGGLNLPGFDFVSMDFAREGLLQWWTFENHQQHYVAQSVLPLELTFPFW